ncbi:MAG: leucine-rich repeat domain-containing protein [Clostridiales bacterium]|nr:leucine-rich repeat domain-containing protein [Clostridiales bacterium]
MKQQRRIICLILFMALLTFLPGVGSLKSEAASKGKYFTSGSVFYHTISDSAVEVCGVGKKEKTLVIPGSVSYKGKEYTVVGIANHNLLNAGTTTEMSAEGSDVDVESMGYDWYTYARTDGKSFPKGMRQISGAVIEKVVLPSTLKYIGSGAFAGCDRLKEVQFAKSYRKLTVRKNAFCGTGIKSISFPKGTYAIEEYATGKIENITIPASVKKIGPQVVNADTKNVTISKGNRKYKMKSGVLYTYDEKMLVGISGKVKKVKVSGKTTKIGKYAFAWSRVESVALNNKINEIPKGAFLECSKLKNVTGTEALIKISYGAFKGCYGLTTIGKLPKVKTVERAAFWDCEKLTLEISSEMDIDDNALGGTQVGRYANIIIPQGDTKYTVQNGLLIKTVGDSRIVIKQDDNMNKIEIPEGVTDVAVFVGGQTCEEIVFPASLTQQRGAVRVHMGTIIYKGLVPPQFGKDFTIENYNNKQEKKEGKAKPAEIIIPKGSMEAYKKAFGEDLQYLIWESGSFLVKEQ